MVVLRGRAGLCYEYPRVSVAEHVHMASEYVFKSLWDHFQSLLPEALRTRIPPEYMVARAPPCVNA